MLLCLTFSNLWADTLSFFALCKTNFSFAFQAALSICHSFLAAVLFAYICGGF